MKYLLLVLSVFVLQNSYAQDSVSHTKKIYLNFTVLDIPYLTAAAATVSANGNPQFGDYFKMYANPSMSQSLALSNDLFTATHYGIRQLFRKKKTWQKNLLSNLICAPIYLLYDYSPFGDGWLHEEYHRSMMTLHHLNSFNDMNTFPFGKELVSVNSVQDAQLAGMKASSNPDFVRMMCAGIEGQYHQIHQLQRENFYYHQHLPNFVLYWMSTMNSIFYVNICSDTSFVNSEINYVMQNEGSNVKIRDFTGLDFNAWAYDLFRPDEVYANRGIHPSGVGIKRYIRASDMTAEELAYLAKQGSLQYLNLLSPAMFGFSTIKLKTTEKGSYYGNFAVRHLLTSFGTDISTNIMYQSPTRNYFFAYHHYQNYTTALPGIEMEIIDEPIKIKGKTILLSPKVMLWLQPKDQLFKTAQSEFGGLIGVSANYPLSKRIYLNIGISGKTNGWVMGNMYLKSNFSAIAGLRINIAAK